MFNIKKNLHFYSCTNQETFDFMKLFFLIFFLSLSKPSSSENCSISLSELISFYERRWVFFFNRNKILRFKTSLSVLYPPFRRENN